MNKIFSTNERIKILNSIILNKNILSVNSVASIVLFGEKDVI
jgi:hypothetical protein